MLPAIFLKLSQLTPSLIVVFDPETTANQSQIQTQTQKSSNVGNNVHPSSNKLDSECTLFPTFAGVFVSVFGFDSLQAGSTSC